MTATSLAAKVEDVEVTMERTIGVSKRGLRNGLVGQDELRNPLQSVYLYVFFRGTALIKLGARLDKLF